MDDHTPERKFKNDKLRIEALTHKSFAFENPMSGYHNERLEFLGDAVVSLVVADYLHKKFKEYNEGQLSTLRAKLVCKHSLFNFALQLGLNNHIRLGRGATILNARNNEKVLEDVFEAYVGAVFLDTGKNYSEVMEFLEPLLSNKVSQLVTESLAAGVVNPFYINSNRLEFGPEDLSLDLSAMVDPVNKLQTWSQRRSYGIPQYIEVENSTSVINLQFTFKVLINNIFYGTGTARNKKDAKKQAAINSLEIIVPTSYNEII